MDYNIAALIWLAVVTFKMQGMVGRGKVVAGKWTQLYLNNNTKQCKRKQKKKEGHIVPFCDIFKGKNKISISASGVEHRVQYTEDVL